METNLQSEKTKNPLLNLIIGSLLGVTSIALIVVAFVLNMDKSKAWYIYLMYFMGAILFLAAAGELYYFAQEKLNVKKITIKQMCVIGVFAALSVILYYFAKFNLPFFPSWLDVQFSELPALIVSFMYGPLSGALLILVRFFCKLPGTSTAGVGEIADVLIGLTLVLIAGFIYKKHRTFKGALAAMGIGMVSATFVAVFANWTILIPAYVNIAGFQWKALVGAMNSYMGGVVTEENFMVYYLFVGVLPFNLFRYALVFIITVVIYKRLHMFINYLVGEPINSNKALEEPYEDEDSINEA